MADSLNKHFLLRKLHSLSGLVPIGGFLVVHLWSNSLSRRGPKAYNEMVHGLHEINYLLLVEVFVILLPLLFHAGYGVVIWMQSENLLKGNVEQYGWTSNWLYLLQRISGGIALVYIVYHLYATRLQTYLYPSLLEDLYGYMKAHLANPLVALFYLIGTIAACFHLANGLRLMAITWGVTVGPRAQHYGKVVALGVFVVLSFLGIQGLLGFNFL